MNTQLTAMSVTQHRSESDLSSDSETDFVAINENDIHQDTVS